MDTHTRKYLYHLDGMLSAIARASDPTTEAWAPYYGYTVSRAGWMAEHAAHEAHRLGLVDEDDSPEDEGEPLGWWDERDRDDDDGVQYADPRDERDERGV